MNKSNINKNIIDVSRFSKSTFTLTFAIEILGMDVWHDCNEGWLDLGPSHQAMRIQYHLYPGQCFDLDVLIWPHIVKIWCGNQYGYVRTWQFLERRWFAFSIRHAFVTRVVDLKNHIATITCSMGLGNLSNNAKNDKNLEAYLPPLKFGERRYFGTVLEKEETFEIFIQKFLWNLIESRIPASYLDGFFDTPFNVTDIRHQDAVIFNVQETILKKLEPLEQELPVVSEELVFMKDRRESKSVKEKEKEKKKAMEPQKEKFAICLTGDAILAGAGRITVFDTTGDRPTDLGNMIVFISSNNLPAFDDIPILFVNIEKLENIPFEKFKKARISQIYTRWKLSDEEHNSRREIIKFQKPINFKDRHTKPLHLLKASEIISHFLNDPFEVEIRGIRPQKLTYSQPFFFAPNKNDYNIELISSTMDTEQQDVLIAVTKIDACTLSKKVNGLVRGEFPLYPPKPKIINLQRNTTCTNDINASIVLDAQMTLEVTLGLVGCKTTAIQGYSRLYCLTCDLKTVNGIISKIVKINKLKIDTNEKDSMLTGFAIDTRDTVIFYVEGPNDRDILKVWELTSKFWSKIQAVFSCTEKFLERMYPEMLLTFTAFRTLKAFVPLSNLLGCPHVYVKPTLPLPARSALLKIGQLIASKLKIAPCQSEMPTLKELESFELELCVPSAFEFDAEDIQIESVEEEKINRLK